MNKGKYKNLFIWKDGKIADVRFWCEPTLTNMALNEMNKLCEELIFDGFLGMEAKGFYLSAIASSLFEKPSVLVRKFKDRLTSRDHQKIEYTNWKGQADTLGIINQSLPKVERVLIVDDVIDTGNSLKAVEQLLGKYDIKIAGAFYLVDSRQEPQSNRFDYPVLSLLKHEQY